MENLIEMISWNPNSGSWDLTICLADRPDISVEIQYEPKDDAGDDEITLSHSLWVEMEDDELTDHESPEKREAAFDGIIHEYEQIAQEMRVIKAFCIKYKLWPAISTEYYRGEDYNAVFEFDREEQDTIIELIHRLQHEQARD